MSFNKIVTGLGSVHCSFPQQAKFLDPPSTSFPKTETNEDLTLHNAYLEMLVATQHTPYFAKYLRSSDPRATDNTRLAPVLASRLFALAPRWDQQIFNPPSDRQPDYFVIWQHHPDLA